MKKHVFTNGKEVVSYETAIEKNYSPKQLAKMLNMPIEAIHNQLGRIARSIERKPKTKLIQTIEEKSSSASLYLHGIFIAFIFTLLVILIRS